MNLNGQRIPWAVAVGVLTFTFWLGGLSLSVQALGDDVDNHVKSRGHDQANTDLATIKAKLEANSKTIDEIKKELDNQAKTIQENQKEILRAIKESE